LGGESRLGACGRRDPREAGESGGSLQMTLNSCRDYMKIMGVSPKFILSAFCSFLKKCLIYIRIFPKWSNRLVFFRPGTQGLHIL
jgi:hypothetical protein